MTQRKRKEKGDQGVDLKDRENHKIQKPKKYKVVLYNDDYTPMDFVVAILKEVFHKPPVLAVDIMMNVHESGKGIAGVYSKEIADTKVNKCIAYAVAYSHPFRVEAEPE